MRALIVAILIHGLVPAIGEAAEAVVHYAATGHLAHTADDAGDLGELGDEHGCGATEHHCACCPSLAAAPAPSPMTVSRLERAVALHSAAESPPMARSLEPPFRPPIS